MPLHEAIDKILRESKRPMSSRELADEINARGLYIRPSDGEPLQAKQVAESDAGPTETSTASTGITASHLPSRGPSLNERPA